MEILQYNSKHAALLFQVVVLLGSEARAGIQPICGVSCTEPLSTVWYVNQSINVTPVAVAVGMCSAPSGCAMPRSASMNLALVNAAILLWRVSLHG
jgi:hypothetical protein